MTWKSGMLSLLVLKHSIVSPDCSILYESATSKAPKGMFL